MRIFLKPCDRPPGPHRVALRSGDTQGEKVARALVQQAKVSLGERGTP